MSGTLYVDGKKLCDIRELDFAEPLQSSEIKTVQIPKETTVEFETYLYLSPWLLLSLMTGMQITNNWMKMHGGIMERKVQIAKARKMMRRRGRGCGKGKSNNQKSDRAY